MNPTPRSTLHPLAAIGVGTADSESLLSYFCRLAVSHAVSTTDLARFVVNQVAHDIRPDFEWQQRNLSGVGEAARSWSAWLSALTGVGHLDALTLSNWSAVLPPRNLAPRRTHWCPHCLREDRERGRDPYFRLAWEVGPVNACARHKVRLVDTCPHCGEGLVRHQHGVMVPGWCTRCGGCLGVGDAQPAEPKQLWVARQVGDWIASQSNVQDFPVKETVLTTLNTLILGLDGGQYARFAKRIGMAKSSVFSWLRQGGLPTLEAYLAMAGFAGLSLDQVLRGNLEGWTPTHGMAQLAMGFDLAGGESRDKPRHHDWAVVRGEMERLLKLPEPISVAEAGRRLGIDDRHLYLKVNELARAMGERWKTYQASRKVAKRDLAKATLKDILPEIVGAGRPFNLNEIRQSPQAPSLASVEGLFGLIREVREEML